MLAPSDFVQRLERLFDGRLRIRWSHQRDEWHIEYKIAPGQVVNSPIATNDDMGIRARDGYAFVMAVRTGDRMPCPKCGMTIKVPVLKTGQAVCDYCRMQGHHGRYPAAYYPLEGDLLIEHLKLLDPLRGWNTGLAKRADAANERILKERFAAFQNHVEAATKDNILDLMQIPHTAFGGVKRFTGAQ